MKSVDPRRNTVKRLALTIAVVVALVATVLSSTALAGPRYHAATNPLRHGVTDPLKRGVTNPLRRGVTNPFRSGVTIPFRSSVTAGSYGLRGNSQMRWGSA
jgi:hypothetical protein